MCVCIFMCAGVPGEQNLCIFMCADTSGGQNLCICMCAGVPAGHNLYIFMCAGALGPHSSGVGPHSSGLGPCSSGARLAHGKLAADFVALAACGPGWWGNSFSFPWWAGIDDETIDYLISSTKAAVATLKK